MVLLEETLGGQMVVVEVAEVEDIVVAMEAEAGRLIQSKASRSMTTRRFNIN